MQRKSSGNLEWLEFDLFQEVPNLIHGLFLRHGGISEPPYDTLNLAYDIGDREGAVATNLERVQRTLDIGRLVYAKQVHGTHLVEVERSSQVEYPDCDGFYTAHPGVGVMVKHADCQAALFYDPLERVIAAVHCGWRGSVQNIYAHTAKALKLRYGSRPEELLVGISPSLGPEGAEFLNYREELPEPFWEFQTRPNHFDFWEISRHQLLDAGLLPDHIEIAKICTYSEPHDWFSYRRDGLTGRHGSLIAIR